MTATKFRLEPVLRYRRSIEQKWQAEVARTLSEMVEEQRRRALGQRERAAGHQRLTVELGGGLDGLAVRAYSDYLRGIDARIEESVVREQQLDKILRQKQRNLLQATKDRKVVDRLREIALERERRERLVAEQKEIDDFAAMRHARRESTS
jgi:flagellar protein FliJ